MAHYAMLVLFAVMTDAVPPTRAACKAAKRAKALRSVTLSPVRCTVADRVRIAERAQRCDMTVSAYIRKQALSGRIVVRQSVADDELIEQVRRVGVNLNQLAHHANSTGVMCSEWEQTRQRAEQVLDKLMQLGSGGVGDADAERLA